MGVLGPGDGLGVALDGDVEVTAHGEGAAQPDGWLAGELKVAAERFERIVERDVETSRRWRCLVVHLSCIIVS